MIKFQAIRLHNGRPVATRVDGKKKLATFKCLASEFLLVAGSLKPRFETIECEIIGVPLQIPTNGAIKIRPRQLFTRFFDFYEVK
jgi:hypothetical protein